MKVLVIGLGISGCAVVEYLLDDGDEVVGADKVIKNRNLNCEIVSDAIDFGIFDFDLVVVSPGVRLGHRLILKAIAHDIEVIGEAELACRNIPNIVVGVTGSNGKSTCVSLIAHALNCSGINCALLGNIGTPLISDVRRLKKNIGDIVVAEISSFQLETMKTKAFKSSVILNITSGHLDRHETMSNYAIAKRNIGYCTKNDGSFYVGEDVLQKYGELFLGLSPIVTESAPIAICKDLGVSEEMFFSALTTFKKLPHRLQFLGNVRGVNCYNDSKATNVEAVSYAVKEIGKDIVLIAGGRDKGCDFSVWNSLFYGKVKNIILIGESKKIIANSLNNEIDVTFASTLKEAVQKGLQVAKKGDNLLFSPGCASFDMFVNFEDRGNRFIMEIDDESKRDCIDSCVY